MSIYLHDVTGALLRPFANAACQRLRLLLPELNGASRINMDKSQYATDYLLIRCKVL